MDSIRPGGQPFSNGDHVDLLKIFSHLLVAFLALICLTACDRPKQQKVTVMSEVPLMNHPDVLRVLFHPRTTPKTTPPTGSLDLDIEVEPGILLGCRFFSVDKEAPIILFFHGNGETTADYDMIGSMYQQQNLNFLVTDYRGYGWSGGSPTATAMLSDAHVVFNESRTILQERGYTGPFFVMGRSLGSACAIELAAHYNEEISGLIIESGFAETIPLARTLGIDYERIGLKEEDTFNNDRKIEKVTKPTFILHGQLDQLIPLPQAEKLMAASGARSKEMQAVPGADHNSLIAIGGVLYFQAIRQFIDKTTGANDWRKRRKKYQGSK